MSEPRGVVLQEASISEGEVLLEASHLCKTYRPRGVWGGRLASSGGRAGAGDAGGTAAEAGSGAGAGGGSRAAARDGGRAAVRPAVDDVSFVVRAGETLGVVGESGSGKSTLCRLALRLSDADAGTVRLCGRDITHLSGRSLRAIRPLAQMVFQNPFACFDPRVRLASSLVEPVVEHRLERGRAAALRRVEGLLGECGLVPDVLDRFPAELSGGQLQRLAIVRALSLEPRVLVADEVVSALDVVVQDEVLRLLERLVAERGMGMLLVSHDLAVVRRVSSYVLVMREGRVVDEGTPERLFSAAAHPYTRQLVAAIPSLPRRA